MQVAIIGGGPHALAVLSALHARTFDPSSSDVAHTPNVDDKRSDGLVAVIDGGKQFCELWNNRFQSLEIDRLRSPLYAHPDAYDEQALLTFATETGRTAEISHPGGKEVSQDNILHGKPSSDLFQDFCEHLASKYEHKWVQSKATAVVKDKKTGKYRVLCGSDYHVIADAVVVATGPQGKWQLPAAFRPFVATPAVVHTSELFAVTGTTLGKALLERTKHLPAGSRVLVIGGGLSAVQAALAAARAGFRVSLRSREPLRTRDYDVSAAWMDNGEFRSHLHEEFLSVPLSQRGDFLQKAVGGGSVPAAYLNELHREAANTGRVDVGVQLDMETMHVKADGDGLSVNGDRYDLVVLATGVSLDPGSTPLYQQLRQAFPTAFMGGFPWLDRSLRWLEEEDIFVVGCNASLQLGPGALSLVGAMRSGRVVAEALARTSLNTAGTRLRRKTKCKQGRRAWIDESEEEEQGEQEEGRGDGCVDPECTLCDSEIDSEN